MLSLPNSENEAAYHFLGLRYTIDHHDNLGICPHNNGTQFWK